MVWLLTKIFALITTIAISFSPVGETGEICILTKYHAQLAKDIEYCARAAIITIRQRIVLKVNASVPF